MKLPDFLESAFELSPAYGHLSEDQWAVAYLNACVADNEARIHGCRNDWAQHVPAWHAEVMASLDAAGNFSQLTIAPPPWNEAVKYACSVSEALRVVVVERASSVDELLSLSIVLYLATHKLARQFFQSHLISMDNPDGIELTFSRFVSRQLTEFEDRQVAEAWQQYHAKLRSALVTKPPEATSDRDRKVREREFVVLPILGVKRWKINKWATEAGVGKNCAYEYLGGTRDLTEPNRRAMAEALGIGPEQLPNG